MPPNQPAGAPHLGASWATWLPEDAEASTYIGSDEELELGSDIPSSDPSNMEPLSFPSHATRTPSHHSQEPLLQPYMSFSGPELVMPSIHEDNDADGSWLMPRESMPTSYSRVEAVNNTSDHPATEVLAQAGAAHAGTRSRSRHESLKGKRYNGDYSILRRRMGYGLSIALVIFVLPLLFAQLVLQFPSFCGIPVLSSIHHCKVTVSRPAEDRQGNHLILRYEPVLRAFSQLENILDRASKSASVIPTLLKSSDMTARDLCHDLKQDYIASRHEISFECQSALTSIQEAKERSDGLTRRLNFVIDDGLAPDARRMQKLLAASSSHADEGWGLYRFISRLYPSQSGFSTSRQAMFESQLERCESTLDHVTRSQMDQARRILDLLSEFSGRLQSVEEIILSSDANANHEGSDPFRQIISWFQRVKHTWEQTLAETFDIQPPTSSDPWQELKLQALEKLRDANERQRGAAAVLNAFVAEVQQFQGETEAIFKDGRSEKAINGS
ncbi:hypothetical protein AJ80_01823 [Polytolypa hystricis UAMH7299]|uniref:Uncharacterized protein n=1 Tax=Polytolypa hystricis (strain UAMH7299) TaxID=1447883 RepID=A0A2B7YZU1_POLH7|nr:hypothetical protein AJ80_01823 [Polytolypa hystricis UAMH7299]